MKANPRFHSGLWSWLGQLSPRARKSRSICGDALELLEVRVVPAKTPVGPHVVLTQAPNSFTTESGGTASFQVSLSEALFSKKNKTGSVTIGFASSNTKEGKLDRDTIVFTPANAATPQTIVVTGLDDSVVDGNKQYTVGVVKIKATNLKSFDKTFPDSLKLFNQDNDAVSVKPALGFSKTLLTVDDASSGEVAIRLATKPLANVTVSLDVIEGRSQGTISASELTFTPSNWNVAQKVFIGMYMEGLHDGDQLFVVSVESSSDDANYAGLRQSIGVTNRDIDPLEVSLSGRYTGSYELDPASVGTAGLPTTTGDVELFLEDGIVSVMSPGGGSGTYTGDSVSFSIPLGGGFPGEIAFTGKIREIASDAVSISGDWAFASSPGATPLATGSWRVIGPLPEIPGVDISPSTDEDVLEGDSIDFDFTLDTQPTADVEVSFIMSSGSGEVQLSTSTLIFTPENWDEAQTLTITGVQDNIDDGDQDFVFLVGTNSTDMSYATLPRQTVVVQVVDSGVVTQDLDGAYDGTFEGTTVYLSGAAIPRVGKVEFNISGTELNGSVSIKDSGTGEFSDPFGFNGNITDGVGVFTPTSGILQGAIFTGRFRKNSNGSVTGFGEWTFDFGIASGSGTWSAIRPVL